MGQRRRPNVCRRGLDVHHLFAHSPGSVPCIEKSPPHGRRSSKCRRGGFVHGWNCSQHDQWWTSPLLFLCQISIVKQTPPGRLSISLLICYCVSSRLCNLLFDLMSWSCMCIIAAYMHVSVICHVCMCHVYVVSCV